MYSWLLGLALVMMVYGITRFTIARLRHEGNVLVHVLWIPGAGFLYAFGILLYVWCIL